MLPIVMLALFGTALTAFRVDEFILSDDEETAGNPGDDPATGEPGVDLPGNTPGDDPTAEDPGDPWDLVSVVTEDGTQLAQDEFWSEEETRWGTRFNVTGTDGDDTITVDATTLDPDAAFYINVRPGDGDDSVTIGIGTDVTMPAYDDGEDDWTHADDIDNDTGADDITVLVDEGRLDEISDGWARDGEPSGWIDLSDDDDSLHFEFDDDVTGNFHLVQIDEGAVAVPTTIPANTSMSSGPTRMSPI